MIMTVTINSAIDKVLLIDKFISGFPMQAKRVINCVGGKGLDASVVLSNLGIESISLTIVAGETGKQLIGLLGKYRIITEPIWAEGETRTCYVVAETESGHVSHIKNGELCILPKHLTEFKKAFIKNLKRTSWVICAGSIPQTVPVSIYGELVENARQEGIPVLVDSSQDAILETVTHHPAIVKMNRVEFEKTFHVQTGKLLELIQAARNVYEKHDLENFVITCADEGILAYTPDGIFHAQAPKQSVINAAGAGDAVSASLTWRLTEGDSWQAALRWAAATAAATVITEGTADCNIDDVKRFEKFVSVSVLSLGD